jgi:hypothetical protein
MHVCVCVCACYIAGASEVYILKAKAQCTIKIAKVSMYVCVHVILLDIRFEGKGAMHYQASQSPYICMRVCDRAYV